MKNIFILPILLVLYGCASVTQSSNIQKGLEKEIRKVRVVKINSFIAPDELYTLAIKNSIIDSLMSFGIRVIEEGQADAIIKGTITFTADAVSSSGAFLGSYGGAAVSSQSAGRYVSGITAQIIKDNEIIGSATVTQVRSDSWIPDPAEVMGKKIGKIIGNLLKGVTTDSTISD